MEESNLADTARQLSDLEVALFICLAAREHCLIETASHCINDLAKELALVCLSTEYINYSLTHIGRFFNFQLFIQHN